MKSGSDQNDVAVRRIRIREISMLPLFAFSPLSRPAVFPTSSLRNSLRAMEASREDMLDERTARNGKTSFHHLNIAGR